MRNILSDASSLGSLAHELRTPLNCIIGFSGALLLEYSGPLNAEQSAQLERVQASGNRLLELINDLLERAKHETDESAPWH